MYDDGSHANQEIKMIKHQFSLTFEL